MSEPIPVLDLKPEIAELRGELEKAFAAVLDSTGFILGPRVADFEKACAEYMGCEHAIGVNSGTDAIVLGLRALGIGPGDEVVTTPFTFFATAEGIGMVGARPVFVDIEPGSFNLDVSKVADAITEKTKAIMPVHLFGQSCDMDPLMELAKERDLKVIEDVAQAFGGEYRGKKVGTIGHVGAFSFFPSKNLGGFGDGGLVTTDDGDLAEKITMLRKHGARKKYFNEILGYNSRLDALQAALLAVKLPHIDRFNDGRREAACRYEGMLADVEGVTAPPSEEYARHVFHQYTVRIAGGKRDEVQAALKEEGISSMIYYPVPCHQLPLYKGQYPEMPVSEKAAEEVLSLPIWPTLDEAKQRRVVDALKKALA